MNKIKLCIMIPVHWTARMGGSQYQAKILIETLLSRKRYEIFYLTNLVNPDFSPDGYEIIQVGKIKNIRRRHDFFFEAPKLISILRKIKPDIIYQRIGCVYTGIAACYAKANHCKMIWHISHDRTVLPFEGYLSIDLPSRYLEKKILEYGIAHADHIVAQTEQQKILLRKHYGRRASVIPNFHPAPKEEINKKQHINVVWVANFKPWKQPELFVKLARDLSHLKNVTFLMIGAANHERYKHLIMSIEELDNLKYFGACSQEEVNTILAKSHIFVNTSRYEGFANTFVQAWMRDLPVVSLNVNPDAVFNREAIGFFSNGNDEILRQQVITLIEDEKLRNTMGTKARTYALAHHSEENISRLIKILDAYSITASTAEVKL